MLYFPLLNSGRCFLSWLGPGTHTCSWNGRRSLDGNLGQDTESLTPLVVSQGEAMSWFPIYASFPISQPSVSTSSSLDKIPLESSRLRECTTVPLGDNGAGRGEDGAEGSQTWQRLLVATDSTKDITRYDRLLTLVNQQFTPSCLACIIRDFLKPYREIQRSEISSCQ